MRLFFITLLYTLLAVISFGQSKINLALKKELDSIYSEDQKYRLLLFSDKLKGNNDSIAKAYNVEKKDLLNHLITIMQKVDSNNLARVEELIRQYGYPGKNLVGTPTNEAAFFVLQHSQNIDKYLPVVEKAAMEEELSFQLYAMMLDRSLMYSGKEQLYGTQGKGIEVTNAQTGKKIFKKIVWPIKEPKSVNELRRKAGFKETVEENAKRLGIEYEIYTLEQVKALEEK